MGTRPLILLAVAILALCYMGYVLVRLIRSHSFTTSQKLMQSALVVCLPVLGAMIVHAVLRTDAQEPAKEDWNFEKQDIGAL